MCGDDFWYFYGSLNLLDAKGSCHRRLSAMSDSDKQNLNFRDVIFQFYDL